MRVSDGWMGVRQFAAVGVILLGILTGFAGAILGQAATGTITGTVTDPKGLVVPDVNVLIRNTETGIKKTVQTNSAGIYTVPALQPGNYDVTATKDGFATVENNNITLLVGQILAINVQMPLQSQQSVVTVTSEAPLVETEKTEASQDISQKMVTDLPIAARRWENFVLLTPGVTADGPNGLTSFHGISGLYNTNSVDGANDMDSFWSEARGRASVVAYVYSADSIKEFQVASSNYSAEFGQAAGGAVNAVTKSGTNNIHGDLFYNLRYPTLNALDPVSKVSAAATDTVPTQPVHQQQQFGGSVGGPILKDKLFYFITLDGYRKVNPITYTTSEGTSPGTLPISQLTCPAELVVAQCTAAKSFILTDLLGVFPRNLKQNIAFGKLDYQVNQANHLSAAFNFQDWEEPFANTTAPTVANQGATNNGTGGTHERFLIASWTTTISSDKVNELRYQWGRDFEFNGTYAPAPNILLTNLFQYGQATSLPATAVPDERRNQVSDNFSFGKGRHAFKVGVDFNFIDEDLILPFSFGGQYQYTSAATLPAATGCPTTGPSAQANGIFCDWLLDLYGVNVGDGKTGQHYNLYTQANDPLTPSGQDDFHDYDYAAFFEDTWKVRPNLTLNLGLRYDIQFVPAPFHPNTDTPLTTLYTSTLHIDTGGIQPRIGIAWAFSKNSVLRVGYGIFYGKTSDSQYYALRDQNGIVEQTYNCNPATCPTLTFPNVQFTPSGLPPAAPFTVSNAPASEQPLTPHVLNPGSILLCPGNPTCSVRGMVPWFVNPRAQEGEVTFERQLPGNMSVSVGYLVTRGLHLPADVDLNLAPSTTTRTYDVVNSSGVTQFTKTVPFYTTRLNPSQGVMLTAESIANSWYNAMVVTIRKPIVQGLEVLANYTLSLSTDDGMAAGTSGTFYGTDGILDPYNQRGEIGHSDLDNRNRLVTSVVWTPPYAKNLSNKYERGLLDGWALSGILTSTDGEPYSELISSNSPQPGGIDGGMTGGTVQTQGNPYGGRVAWMPRNSFTLPYYTNIDFRVSRQFTIKDRYNFEFRVDAFNLFNSTIVQAVNEDGYNFAVPSATSTTCPSSLHTNECIFPIAGFQSPTTTTGVLLGARQLQIGGKFSF